MVSNIDREDIIKVASEMNIPLDDSQVNRVLHLYQHEEECSVDCDWEFIVNDCILQIVTQ